jgi:uncharacterized membrane protein
MFNKGFFDSLIKIQTGGTVDPKDIVVRIINYALFFIGVIAFVFVIYGGILYITSGGDADKTTKARNTLMYAVLGIIIVAIAALIVRWAGGAPIVT